MAYGMLRCNLLLPYAGGTVANLPESCRPRIGVDVAGSG
jgi:hypothetical protein